MVPLQFIREMVDNVKSSVTQQHGIGSDALEGVKATIPAIQASWIGGDSQEYAADVLRKIVPAMLELLAAIAGININLTKATSIVDQADSKVKSLAGGLSDLFGGIC